MDRSPLLYVHVGLSVQPTKAAWWPWLLTLKVVSESRMTWATFVPILVFLSVLELGPMNATDRQRDVRQNHCLMPPPIRSGGTTKSIKHCTNYYKVDMYLWQETTGGSKAAYYKDGYKTGDGRVPVSVRGRFADKDTVEDEISKTELHAAFTTNTHKSIIHNGHFPSKSLFTWLPHPLHFPHKEFRS